MSFANENLTDASFHDTLWVSEDKLEPRLISFKYRYYMGSAETRLKNEHMQNEAHCSAETRLKNKDM